MQTSAILRPVRPQAEPSPAAQVDALAPVLAHCAYLLKSACIVITDDTARRVALRAANAADAALKAAGRCPKTGARQ